MKVKVFAKLKDFFEKEFEVTTPVQTVAELQRHLIGLNPASAGVLDACRFAVNDEFVDPEFELKADEYVTVIPPSSGG